MYHYVLKYILNDHCSNLLKYNQNSALFIKYQYHIKFYFIFFKKFTNRKTITKRGNSKFSVFDFHFKMAFYGVGLEVAVNKVNLNFKMHIKQKGGIGIRSLSRIFKRFDFNGNNKLDSR